MNGYYSTTDECDEVGACCSCGKVGRLPEGPGFYCSRECFDFAVAEARFDNAISLDELLGSDGGS